MLIFWSSNEKYFNFEIKYSSNVFITKLKLTKAIKELDILRISKSTFFLIVLYYFHQKHSFLKVLQSNRINYSCFTLIVKAFTKCEENYKYYKLNSQEWDLLTTLMS